MDTKSLTNQLASTLGRPISEVETNIRMFADILVECVKNDEAVSMPGFGTFEPKVKEERKAIHPATGKKLLVPPKLILVFKPSAILKQKVRK